MVLRDSFTLYLRYLRNYKYRERKSKRLQEDTSILYRLEREVYLQVKDISFHRKLETPTS